MSLIDTLARWLGWPAVQAKEGESGDRRRYDRKWWRFDRRSVAPALLGSTMIGPQPALATADAVVTRKEPESDSHARVAGLREKRLYVAGTAAQQAWRARRADPDHGARPEAMPVAHWFGDWNADVAQEVDRLMEDAAATGSMPVLVTYDIPHRDFDSDGGGGAPDAMAYRDWIRDFARGVGHREAIVILEPDALPLISCLTHECRSERFSLLREAVGVLSSRTRARVYLDAGHALWVDAEEMAQRLHLAGIAAADGFALNVGATVSTDRNLAYGEELSRRSSGARFVIDTSRNGAADGDGRFQRTGALPGHEPTVDTGHPRVDAFLWIEPAGREARAARSA